jgi:hypothetical protein
MLLCALYSIKYGNSLNGTTTLSILMPNITTLCSMSLSIMMPDITTLSFMSFSILRFGTMTTLIIMALSKMLLSILTLGTMTPSIIIMSKHNSTA